MDISVLIVEDEFPIALDIKTRLLAAGYDSVTIASGYDDALLMIKNKTPDIALLDINLSENKSGIDLGVLIHHEHNFPVVFITAYAGEKSLDDALKANPMGYITKPFKDVDLRNNVKLALKKFHGMSKVSLPQDSNDKAAKYFFVKEKGGMQRLEIENISWLEAMDNYTIIHLEDHKHIVNAYLKDVTAKLGNNFIRIHRSHAVAVNKISAVQDNFVKLGTKELILSQTYRSVLLDRLNII